jgi:hypothetical protein
MREGKNEISAEIHFRGELVKRAYWARLGHWKNIATY